MLENISLLISKYAFWLVIAIIIGILLYYFFMRNKSPSTENKSGGFGAMYDKIINSDFVKNVQEQNESADPGEFLPKELFTPSELEPKKKKIKPEKNPFATDFSNIHKVNI